MTALEVLAAARTQGIRLRVEGSDLVLSSDREPEATLLFEIERKKTEIVALLSELPEDSHLRGDLQVLDADRLRRWFVVATEGLKDERILLIANPRLEDEARAAHPDLVLYMPWEVKSLLTRGTSPAFAARIHLVKKMFDGVIMPNEEEEKS